MNKQYQYRTWVRAKDCESANCVEVCFEGDLVLVRANGNPLLYLTLYRYEWDQLRTGEFEEPANE